MGLERKSYCASQLWNLVPVEIKQSSVSIFKEKIKTWYCDDCPSPCNLHC